MTFDESKEKLIEAAQDYIPLVWTKRINPLRPEEGPHYPGRVTEIIEMTIDGEEMIFFVSVRGRAKAEVEDAAKTLS